jgi:hypothetical protein
MMLFGELADSRAVCGAWEGVRIQREPVDERLALLEGDFANVAVNWARGSTTESDGSKHGRVRNLAQAQRITFLSSQEFIPEAKSAVLLR